MSDFPDDQFSGEGHQGEDHSCAPDDENQEQGIHRDLFFGVIRNWEEQRVHGELERHGVPVEVGKKSSWKLVLLTNVDGI